MSGRPKLRYVDPRKRRGRLYLAVCRLSATKPGAWLATKIAWKLDPYLLKFTNGRFSTAGPLATALLESRGLPFRAELVEDEAERQRLWDLADRVFPEYADYREQAGGVGRVIPIFQLTPR